MVVAGSETAATCGRCEALPEPCPAIPSIVTSLWGMATFPGLKEADRTKVSVFPAMRGRRILTECRS